MILSKYAIQSYPILSNYLPPCGFPDGFGVQKCLGSKAEGSCAFLAEKRFPKVPKSKVRWVRGGTDGNGWILVILVMDVPEPELDTSCILMYINVS